MTIEQVAQVIDPEFKQVVVWEGVVFGEGQTVDDFMNFLKSEFPGIRFKYLEHVSTNPDRDIDGYEVRGTGGRIDQLFCVHYEDISKFAVKRLQYGMRWLEDVCSPKNGGSTLYPKHVYSYQFWALKNETVIVEEDDNDN